MSTRLSIDEWKTLGLVWIAIFIMAVAVFWPSSEPTPKRSPEERVKCCVYGFVGKTRQQEHCYANFHQLSYWIDITTPVDHLAFTCMMELE